MSKLSDREASELFIRTLKDGGRIGMRPFLERFFEHGGVATNPFTKEETRCGSADLHDILKEAGVLDHPGMRRAIAGFYQEVCEMQRWSLMTLHDEAWWPEGYEHGEATFEIGVKDGPVLLKYLHELDSGSEDWASEIE